MMARWFIWLLVAFGLSAAPSRAQQNFAYPTIPSTAIQSSDAILLEGTRFTTQIYTTLPIMAQWMQANMGLANFSCAGSTWPKSAAAGVTTCTQVGFSNLSGQIAAGQLIAPAGGSALGGVKSSTAGANQFATGIDVTGAVIYAQPTAANILGLSPYGLGTTGTGANATAADFGSANQALWLVGGLSGSGAAPYGLISIADTATGSTAVPALSGLWLAHNINTGAGQGNRFSLMPVLTKNVALSGSDASKKFYTPLFSQHYIKAGDGGSAVGPTYYGAHYGMASLVQAQSGATYLKTVQGNEIDISMQAGSSSQYKSGLLIASVNSDAVKGSSYEALLSFGRDSTTTATWDRAIDFNWPLGLFPFSATATLIGSSAGGSVGYGVDLSNLTIATSAFKSSGFDVTGAGAATVASLTSNGALVSQGASGGVALLSRTGSGNTYQIYNPAGSGLKVFDGSTDILSLTSTGGIYAGAEIAPASVVVGSLGGCNSGTRGALRVVTDGAAGLAWGAAQTSGASSVYLSFCNGAAWTVAAK